MEEQNKKSLKERLFTWHDTYYKALLIIPILLLVFAVGHLYYFQSQNNGDLFKKDISLTGGTTAIIYDENLDVSKLLENLSPKLDSLSTRIISDVVSGKQKAVIITTRTDGEQTQKIIEEYVGYKLTDDNSSFEFSGASLSEGFYKQLLWANFFAFIAMSLVVFILFRSFVPSFTVISCAFADILLTLVTVNMLGIELSSAGIVAFLMLIGYSVDTDILLTTRMLKRTNGSLNDRIWSSFKTGSTMTLTSLIGVLVALLIVQSFSVVLSQIFLVLVIGLFYDILNTWITNVSILKWYVLKKGAHHEN